jgi:hypothetical protein
MDLSHENLNFITFGSHDAKLASDTELTLEEQSRNTNNIGSYKSSSTFLNKMRSSNLFEKVYAARYCH